MDDPVRGPEVPGPPPEQPEPRRDVFGKPPTSRSAVRFVRPTLWGLLLVYIVIFLFSNRQQVRVDFVFFTAQAPLIIALLVSHIIGIVVGGGALIFKGRRDRQRGQSQARAKDRKADKGRPEHKG